MFSSNAMPWMNVLLGCCTAPMVAGLVVHQRVQQWLTQSADDEADFWQDSRLPTLDRPVASAAVSAGESSETSPSESS